MSNDREIIVNCDYGQSVLQVFKEFRETAKFCDIKLRVSNETFSAHRIILSSSSEYFKNMLTKSFAESVQHEIELEDINSNAMRTLLDYFYSGSLALDGNNVRDILKAADYFQILWAKEECCKYLQKSINPENCLAIWKLSWRLFCHDLEKLSKTKILENLNNIIEEFNKLSLEELKKLLRNDERSTEIRKSQELFKAIVSWTKYDLDHRKEFLFDLLENFIETKEISEQFAKSTILKESIIRENNLCLNWVLDKFYLLNQIDSKEDPEDTLLKHATVGQVDDPKFFITHQRKTAGYIYDINKAECRSVANCPVINSHFPVVYKNNIYLTGGYNNETNSKTCDVYNVQNNEWNQIPMDLNTHNHGSCVLNDNLYVVGGLFDKRVFNNVKQYSFETGQLFSLRSTLSARDTLGIAAHENCIYVCGGEFNNLTAERFDVREGRWTWLPNMLEGGWCSATMLSNAIYCLNRSVAVLEKFDIRQNQWLTLSKNLKSRIRYNFVATDNKNLYRITSEGLYQFNFGTDNWIKIFHKRVNIPIGVIFDV